MQIKDGIVYGIIRVINKLTANKIEAESIKATNGLKVFANNSESDPRLSVSAERVDILKKDGGDSVAKFSTSVTQIRTNKFAIKNDTTSSGADGHEFFNYVNSDAGYLNFGHQFFGKITAQADDINFHAQNPVIIKSAVADALRVPQIITPNVERYRFFMTDKYDAAINTPLTDINIVGFSEGGVYVGYTGYAFQKETFTGLIVKDEITHIQGSRIRINDMKNHSCFESDDNYRVKIRTNSKTDSTGKDRFTNIELFNNSEAGDGSLNEINLTARNINFYDEQKSHLGKIYKDTSTTQEGTIFELKDKNAVTNLILKGNGSGYFNKLFLNNNELFNGQVMDSGADVNNFTTGIGVFRPGSLNAPNSEWWWKIESTGSDTELILQVATSVGSPNSRYWRNRINSNWSAWTAFNSSGISVTNNLLAAVPGTALDAVQGKVLNGKIDAIGTNCVNFTPKLLNQNGVEVKQDKTGGDFYGQYHKIGHLVFFAIQVKTKITESGATARIELPAKRNSSNPPVCAINIGEMSYALADYGSTGIYGIVAQTAIVIRINKGSNDAKYAVTSTTGSSFAYIKLSGWYSID